MCGVGVVALRKMLPWCRDREKRSGLKIAVFCEMMQEKCAIAYTCRTMMMMIMSWKEKYGCVSVDVVVRKVRFVCERD